LEFQAAAGRAGNDEVNNIVLVHRGR
jgi:hypothetical protein